MSKQTIGQLALLFVALLCGVHWQVECWRVSQKAQDLRDQESDKSSWRNLPNQKRQLQNSEQFKNLSAELEREDGASRGKLIEWDDDDEGSWPTGSFGLKENQAYLHNNLDFESRPKPGLSGSRPASPVKQTSRLIYHGRVSASNDSLVAKRVVDGIEMRINTHIPVVISRRSLASGWSASGGDRGWRSASHKAGKPFNTLAQSSTLSDKKKTSAGWEDIYSTATTTTTTTGAPPTTSTSLPTLPEPSASDWRPILVSSTIRQASRSRRSGRTAGLIKKTTTAATAEGGQASGISDGVGTALLASDKQFELDFKWKPITKEKQTNGSMLDLNKNTLGESVIISNRGSTAITRKQSRKSSIEEPFDDADDDLEGVEVTSSDEKGAVRVLKPAGDESAASWPSNKWTPLVASTRPPEMNGDRDAQAEAEADSSEGSMTSAKSSSLHQGHAMTTTTSAPSTSSFKGTNSSSALLEQRSASDLNYIYSSQPQQQQPIIQSVGSSASPSSSSSYYTNYIVPSSQPVASQVPAPELPLIDTTSGQTPEMIADRTPGSEPNDAYSMPIVAASFQPAQPPPSGRPTYYAGGSSGYGSAEFSAPVVASSAPNSPALSNGNFYAPAQSFRREQSARQQHQVVRQEHHYHYYNQQPPAGPSSAPAQVQQDQRQAVVATPTAAVQPTIIRELQPIMISQPVVQQQSSTPAPQSHTIIREIVREVAPQPQVQTAARLVQIAPSLAAAQPPAQVPIASVMREVASLESAAEFGRASSFVQSAQVPTAQRIIRQLSNSLPQVAVRLPATMAQLRLQMPALQLPTMRSNPAPVTRQTGSFIIPPMPKKTTTYMTETQAMPTHTTIMQTTQFTPATRTTVYTTDHQLETATPTRVASSGYK